jgi:predicted transcriptional regulator
MTYDLKQLKEIRKKFGLTQSGLARKAGVSQSMIAKIEAGILDPTYSKANQVFAALELITKDKEAKAEQMMNKKIISVSSNSDIREAIKYMKKYEISQIPVIDNENVVGMISESIILDAVLNADKDVTVGTIMQEAPPIIPRNASFTLVSNLLKVCPVILVSDKGKMQGLITKSDLIRKIYR